MSVNPASATGVYLKFRSSKPKIIKVDAAGTITTLRKGTCVITVTAGTKKTSVTIRVG